MTVANIPYEEMSPELRAFIAYEPNGALDVADPQIAAARIREQTPVVRWEFGVGFFTMADILAAGRNPDLVAADPVSGTSFGMGSEDLLIPLQLDGEPHRHYRRLLDPLFAPRKMAELEPAIRKLADELIDQFIGDGQVELHDAFCVPLPSTVFLNLFGLPLEDVPVLIGFKDRILKNEGASLQEMDEIGKQAGREMRVYLRQRLAERRASSARLNDLLDSFIHFEVDGARLSDDEVVNIMHMFTIAGLDTVTSSLSCIFAWLASHPAERRLLADDPSRLPAAIEEIMRFESPVPSSGARWAAEDTEVNGTQVKKGEMVYLCWAAANGDPAVFADPATVDFAREPNRHISFASGIHRCLGSHLARNELRVAIEQFHRRIADYQVADGDTIEYQFAGVRQARRLPLTFTAVP